MGRDYKKPRKPPPGPSAAKYLFGGFGLGIVAAAAVYYAVAPAPPREPDRPVPTVQRPAPDTQAPVELVSEAEDEQVDAPSPKPAKERFSFYNMLPRFEVIIPEASERVEDAAAATPISKPGAYVLQAGSFRRFVDADKMKAQLALQGIESYIEKVTIGDDKIYHRVRIGPETQLKKVNSLRNRLFEQDIEALLIRVAE